MSMIERGQRAVRNALRYKAIAVARAAKRLLQPDGPLERDAEILLADLRRFCRATDSTFDPDPHQAARLAGRREVWLRLTNYLNLDEATVLKLVEVDDGL